MFLARMISRLIQTLLFFAVCATAQAGIGLPERLVLLGERIAATPADPNLYLRRALIYSDSGEFKLALADVDTAAQFGPVENTYYVRAILLYRLGQFAQALPLLNQFIKANPTHTEALMYRARVLRDAGQREKALADYRRYFGLQANAEPGDYLTAARLMVELADQNRRGYSRSGALALLDARIAALGNAPQLQRYAIEIEQQSCHSTEVLARLQQLHATARQAPQWHLQVAEQHLLLGQLSAAREQLQAAHTLLAARRPSADKAQLAHRHDFVRDLLVLNDKIRGRAGRIDQVHRQYYPAAAAGKAVTPQVADTAPQAKRQWTDFEPYDAAQSEAAEHPPLGGFEQPQAGANRYEASWSEPVQAFYRCLRNRPARNR